MPSQSRNSQQVEEELARSEFKSGLCGCCDDMGTFVEASVCPCVTAGRVGAANDGRENTVSPLYCVASCMFPMCTMCILNGKTRWQYNIEGSVFGDFCKAFVCTPCSTCQLANEHNRRGTKTGGCFCTPSLGPDQESMEGQQMSTH